MDRPTCETCPYFVRIDWPQCDHDDDGPRGECRRYPKRESATLAFFLALYQSAKDGETPDDGFPDPLTHPEEAGRVWESALSGNDDTSSFLYPIHELDDWCGEHPDFPKWLDSRRAARDDDGTEATDHE